MSTQCAPWTVVPVESLLSLEAPMPGEVQAVIIALTLDVMAGPGVVPTAVSASMTAEVV